MCILVSCNTIETGVMLYVFIIGSYFLFDLNIFVEKHYLSVLSFFFVQCICIVPVSTYSLYINVLYAQYFLIYSLVIALLHILTTECGDHQAFLKNRMFGIIHSHIY
jgi:hypothetical protein